MRSPSNRPLVYNIDNQIITSFVVTLSLVGREGGLSVYLPIGIRDYLPFVESCILPKDQPKYIEDS